MENNLSHTVSVRDKLSFLHRLMSECIESAKISLEGDLAQCRFSQDLVVATEEDQLLKRNTLWPRQDFVILRLEPETVDSIMKQISAAGLSRAIIHVQIERNGVFELRAYDNFHPQCVVTGPRISEELLSEMKSTGIIHHYTEMSAR